MAGSSLLVRARISNPSTSNPSVSKLRYDAAMPRPTRTPLGLHLARTARVVGRAFDEALSAVDGSLPVWLILISLKSRQLANQRQLAEAVGIQEATLSHHLNAMVEGGLVIRERDPD